MTTSDRRGRLRIAWGVGTLAALLGLLWLAATVRGLSIPLLVAFIAAYFVTPGVKALARIGVPRTAAIVAILLGSLLLVGGLFALLGPRLATEFEDLPERTRQIAERVTDWTEAHLGVDMAEARAALQGLAATPSDGEAPGDATPEERALVMLYGGATGTMAALVGAAMTLLFTFFMLRDFDRLLSSIHDLVPPRYREFVVKHAREIDRAMSSFLRGQITVAAILSVLYTVGFLVVGVPMAVVVGLIAGLGNVIPFVGTAIGLALATGLVLIDDPTWGLLLGAWAVFAIVQALEGWVITPKIVGDSLGLSPFTVIVSVMFFGELFGFVGVLIAVPLAAVTKILGGALLDAYRDSPLFAENGPGDAAQTLAQKGPPRDD